MGLLTMWLLEINKSNQPFVKMANKDLKSIKNNWNTIKGTNYGHRKMALEQEFRVLGRDLFTQVLNNTGSHTGAQHFNTEQQTELNF